MKNKESLNFFNILYNIFNMIQKLHNIFCSIVKNYNNNIYLEQKVFPFYIVVSIHDMLLNSLVNSKY